MRPSVPTELQRSTENSNSESYQQNSGIAGCLPDAVWRHEMTPTPVTQLNLSCATDRR